MRKCHKFGFVCILVCMFGIQTTANATLLSIDSGFGTNTLTNDSTSGLDWLDLSITDGFSYSTIESQMGSGLTYDGYRFATYQEVFELWENAGFDHYLTGTGTQPNGSFNTFVNYFGNTFNVDPCLSCFGMIGYTAVENGIYHQYGAFTTSNFGFAPSVDNTYNLGDTPDPLSMSRTGSWLVKASASPVPEPATILLFGTAIFGLFGVAKRKKA